MALLEFARGLGVTMKNFLRALRHAWPYRKRLALSVLCALMAAVLWGLNFTSIYPVLKLLHTNQTPQEWVDERIKLIETDLKKFEPDLDELDRMAAIFRLVDELPVDQRAVIVERYVEERSIREVAARLHKTEGAIKQLQQRALHTLRSRMEGTHA